MDRRVDCTRPKVDLVKVGLVDHKVVPMRVVLASQRVAQVRWVQDEKQYDKNHKQPDEDQ